MDLKKIRIVEGLYIRIIPSKFTDVISRQLYYVLHLKDKWKYAGVQWLEQPQCTAGISTLGLYYWKGPLTA